MLCFSLRLSATATIRKEFTFEASHVLPDHEGKCSRLHGHSYRVEVFVEGEVNGTRGESDDGMVMDFGELSRLVQTHILDHLDHRHLNERLPSNYQPPSAENIARWILKELYARTPHVCRVRLWEGYKSYAEVAVGGL